MMATSLHPLRYCNGYGITARESGARHRRIARHRLAIARALVADGVQVAITGRDAAHLSAARPTIEAAGPGAVETLQADVRRYDEVERCVDATAARFGGLDFLVNNAGVGIFADVGST